MDLAELLTKLEAAWGPGRELDCAMGNLWPEPPFAVSVAAPQSEMPECPAFISSLDAAIMLVEKLLPDWRYTLYSHGHYCGLQPRDPEDRVRVPPHFVSTGRPTLALGLCTVLAKALIQDAPGD